MFPTLVPIDPTQPDALDNKEAWKVLHKWEKPFLTAFSDQDPITAGGDRLFQKLIPGCANQKHTTIKGGGHFLQEDCGDELGKVLVDFIESNQFKPVSA